MQSGGRGGGGTTANPTPPDGFDRPIDQPTHMQPTSQAGDEIRMDNETKLELG